MVLPYSNTDYGEDQVGATNIQELTDVELTNLANGEVLKYNLTSDKWENFAPTYLDGTGISDNFLIKIVSGTTTQTSFIETSVLNTSTSLQTYIPSSSPLSVMGGSIETEFFDSTKRRMHLTTGGIATTNGITITSDGRVGIGVVNPEEDFEIDGNIQLDTGGVQRGRVIFYDKQNDHEHAEVDGLGEGTNGGALVFYTKVDGGSVTEKIRINNKGAIGIAGSNFGTTNQVLISNGSNSAVEWTDSVTFADATVTGTVVTPEVASTTSTIDVGSGVNRRIRIEDKSTTNFGEIEIKPIRTAAGISSNVEPINSYIQFFAQNGASDMTMFAEDLIQIRTNSNSYIRVTPTEATCTSPFTAPTLTASTKLVSPKLETSGELQLAPNGGTNYMAVSYGSNVLKFSPNWGGTSSMYFYNNGSVQTTTIQGRDFCHLIGDNAGITLQNNLITANQQITAPTLKATDSLIYGGDSQSSPPIGLHIKNTLETNTTDLMRLAPLNTGTARIDPEYNHIKFRTFNGIKDLLVRGENRLFLVGGSTAFNSAARITLQQVSGSARVDINGEVVTDSTITCTSLTQTSDARLKRNLAPISDALATIRKLLPQTYEKQGLLDAGFVAQEVETIPELKPYVSTPEDEAPKGLNYSALFTHAVAALQELDTIVQRQASTITALVARISALEGR